MALDWHGPDTASLAKLSYNLHLQLAKEHDGINKWGYRPVDTVSLSCDTSTKRPKSVPGVDWLNEKIISRSSKLGDVTTTSQVHPRLFTQAIAKIAEARGVKIVKGAVSAVTLTETGQVQSVQVDNGQSIPATHVVLAAGPWTGQLAQKILPTEIAAKMNITGYRAHSVSSLPGLFSGQYP